jgi:chromosome segregation ATPase
MSQDKFNKYEEANLDLKREIENLKKQIELKQNEVNDVKILSNRQETIIKNAEIYKENINNMQNDISNKEKELMKNFQNRENKLRNNFISENNKLNTKLDEFRIENEKLKFEISNLKLQIENLQSQIEEKNFEHDSELKKLEKENKKQNEKINEYEKKIPELESILENKSIDYESLISSLKLDNSNLLNELNVYKEKLVEAQGQILNQNHDIEILSIEASQNKINLSNKDAIIEQLKRQIEELGNEINEKENDLKFHYENKENDHVDFTKKINDIMKEKAKLETEKIELEHNLSIATEELKKMKDFINQSAFKENLKKEEIEKQYKNIINQMKNKEKKLYQENLCLRNTINEKDCKIQNMNMSLYNFPLNNKTNFNKTSLNTPKRVENIFNYNEFSKINSPKISNSFNINNIPNNIIQNVHETNTYAFNTINPSNHPTSRNKNISLNYKKFEDPNEENQLKTLEEFKKLLEKIDEKLDKPLILKGECC